MLTGHDEVLLKKLTTSKEQDFVELITLSVSLIINLI